MKYKLLALDVDGTLLDENHSVTADTIDAIAQAGRANLAVCLATGRSYVETLPTWRRLPLSKPYQPMVLIGGAMVSEPDTGRTLYQRIINHSVACEFADALVGAGYCAMAIVDPWRHGIDYVLVESDGNSTIHRQWFSQMNVKVRRVDSLTAAKNLPAILRISAVAPADEAISLADELQRRFAGRMNVHAILAPNYGLTVVEGFAITADKFTALKYIAQTMGVGPGEIAAVGDNVNDLAMIRGAGLGAAMSKAPRNVQQAADHVVTNTIGEFIRQLADGHFD